MKKAGTVRNTYDGNDTTDPRRPSTQHPNSMTEVSLNDERNNCGNDRIVYRGKMGIPEVHVAKSINKPIVGIGPSQCSLSGLQQEDEISCSEDAFASQAFREMLKTNLETSRVVFLLENYSCIHLNM